MWENGERSESTVDSQGEYAFDRENAQMQVLLLSMGIFVLVGLILILMGKFE